MKNACLGLTVLVGLLSIIGCSNLPVTLNAMAGTPKQFESRQIIVTLSEDVRSQWRAIHQEILDQYDVKATGEFPLKSIRVNCLVYRVSDMVDVDEIKRRLSADSRIELVQSNQVFAGLLGDNGKAYGELSYGPKMIHADGVHGTVTGKGVTIAVIDTGADQEHPDLKGHVDATENFVEGGTASFAKDRHGTAVAGVIGALDSNGIGINGIAPDAKIDIYKACWYADSSKDKASCSSWTLAKAIDAAITKGSHIINLSLSGAEDALLKKLLVTANQHH
uniref:S8 family peptidase n=1 Tax=Crenothrix polyspora TaxID=360316 RepID=UPI0015C607F3